MVLDFTKGKYGLQLILLLMTMLISGLIFQLLGMVVINSIYNFDVSALTEDNSTQIIMETPNGYWIFFILMVLNSLGMFILPSLVFANLISKNPSQYLMISKTRSLNFLSLLPVFALAGVVLVSFMGELNMKLSLPDVFKTMENDANALIQYILSFKDSTHLISTLMLMAVIPALGEELFFRAVLQKVFISWTKKNWIGILLTAFIFSAIHFQFLTFLPRFFMGIMLGYLFVWSKNILIPILAHFLHNSVSIIVSFYTESPEIETPETNNSLVVILSFVVMGAVCYAYYTLSKKNHV